MEALQGAYPHGWVALVDGLGLDHVWSSWVFLFLLLLLFLHGLARWMSAGSSRIGSVLLEEVRFEGGDVDHATGFVDRRLTTGDWAVSANERVLTAGWLREGLIVLALGVLAVLVGLGAVERQRMDVVIGATGPGSGESPLGWSMRDGDWQPEAVQISLACGEAQRFDPRQLRMCTGRFASGQTFTGPLGLGHPLGVGEWTVRVVSQTRSIGEVMQLFAQDANSMNRTWSMVRSGSPIGVSVDDERGGTVTHPVTVLPGRFGLSVASQAPDGAPWIHAGIEGPTTPSPLFVRGEGRAVLRVEAARNPGQFWLVGGGIACLLGLLVVLLVPHWHVSIVSDGAGGQLVRVGSLNRPWRAREQIHRALMDGESLEWRTRR